MPRTTKRAERRAPLSRERVLDAAIKLADRGGLESLTMRRLGQELGVLTDDVCTVLARRWPLASAARRRADSR